MAKGKSGGLFAGLGGRSSGTTRRSGGKPKPPKRPKANASVNSWLKYDQRCVEYTAKLAKWEANRLLKKEAQSASVNGPAKPTDAQIKAAAKTILQQYR